MENKGMPLVSVIMPAYRCADTIRKSIDSALNQELPVEVIVINDKSPDHLDLVMEQYENNESVRYLKNEKNLGAAGTRNRGVSLARGRYTAFLDSDDWWERGKLKKQIALMEKEQSVLCSTGRELVDPDGRLTGRVIGVRERITYKSLLLHNCINCSSVVMLTEVAKEFVVEGGYEPMYGARPLKRYLQKHVETLAARLILEGNVGRGSVIIIDVEHDKLIGRVKEQLML